MTPGQPAAVSAVPPGTQRTARCPPPGPAVMLLHWRGVGSTSARPSVSGADTPDPHPRTPLCARADQHSHCSPAGGSSRAAFWNCVPSPPFVRIA